MADTKVKAASAAPKTAPATSEPAKASPVKAKPAAKAGVEKGKRGRPRNYDLGNGVYRFSRSRMYHKKALYKFVGKKTDKKGKPKKPVSVEKKIGGEKNGEKRIVLLKKRRNYYPTADKIKPHPAKKCFSHHRRYTRPTLTPGTICILLAGIHRGKRVVLLKTLDSGLLLVTGPHKINSCPLRRVSQNYVIATSTKLDISGVKLPEHINDKYFKRSRSKRAKKEEGELFDEKKERLDAINDKYFKRSRSKRAKKEGEHSDEKKEIYRPNLQHVEDQKIVDKQVNEVIRKHPDKKHLYAYLSAMFGLRSSQYPHRMKF